jgi:hypothetical protein
MHLVTGVVTTAALKRTAVERERERKRDLSTVEEKSINKRSVQICLWPRLQVSVMGS